MQTSTSDVSICSNALLELGAQVISSFDENTDRARLVSNLYPSTRDEVLRQHLWKCATKRELIAPDAVKPVFGYANAFTLPADFIRVVTINDCERPDYVIENGKILINANQIQLVYVFKNYNASTYDADLIKLLKLSIKSRIAYAITQSTTLAQAAKDEYEFELKRAKSVDSQETPPNRFGESPLLEDRMRG